MLGVTIYMKNAHMLLTQVEIPYIVSFGHKNGKIDHYASIRYDFIETSDMICFYLKHIRK